MTRRSMTIGSAQSVSLTAPQSSIAACRILRLSSASFLDSTISIDHGAPLFAIDTSNNCTTVSRCSPTGLVDVARVHWPSADSPITQVQLHDSSHPAQIFLRPSRSPLCSSGTRKFRHAGSSYRWRPVSSRSGTLECTTSKDALPVATYEPAILTSRAKLRVYEPFAHNLQLVDALVLTAMVLVEQPPQAPSAHTALSRHAMEPQSPGALPRYSVLSYAWDGPRDAKDRSLFVSTSSSSSSSGSLLSPRPSLFSLDTSYIGRSPSSSITPSPISSSDAWSSRPWLAPPRPYETGSGPSSSFTHEPVAIAGFDKHPKSPIIGDEPDPEPFGPPPPYEHHEWTVRVPVSRRTKF